MSWPSPLPRVLLVGGGVVGRAIAECHLHRGIPFALVDRDGAAIAALQGRWRDAGTAVERIESPLDRSSALVFRPRGDDASADCPLIIESIIETRQAKRELFAEIQDVFGGEPVICSNTSTLLIGDLAPESLRWPGRVCGMHFFMPVAQRPAVEIVAGSRTEGGALAIASEHAGRLGKHPIACRDRPGFIVNRMLSPYLNQALLLLCHGVGEQQLARVARAYGMPLSPLELIDWIGAPTMYHAGRAFWAAFPDRLDPSPLVPALVKRRRWGRAFGKGLYDYDACGEIRSPSLAVETEMLLETYRTGDEAISDGDVLLLLAVPMWIEARNLLAEGVTDSLDSVDLAMAGGLGFQGDGGWSEFFRQLGQDRILAAIDRWGPEWRSMRG